MTATTQAVVPALRGVRDAEAVVAGRFTAHAAVTPLGEDRNALERRARTARDHVHSIDKRLGSLQRHGLARSALSGAWRLTAQAGRVPFDMAVGVPVALLRRTAGEEQLLKNAEEQFAVAAYAVAAGRAGEAIAHQAGDAASARVLHSIREEDESLLTELDRSLQHNAKALAATAAAGEPSAGIATRIRSVRGGTGRALKATGGLWHAVRGVAVEGARRARQVPGLVGRPGEVVGEDDLPITDYGALSARQINELLPRLSQEDLATVEAYERAHAGRSTVLHKAATLLGPEPWPGYDRMYVGQIRDRLRAAGPDLAERTLDYENRHRARSTVLDAAVGRIGL